ncbi:MarR family winged helix-turn-helix transcriptional regulator [Actinokineospora spheciospongiae]|uniref:MarR family winged helix-turn-helix transcriptional regulator n=1 Tax=Actinokineospora spheciospongiae TaxID=909613 RepID=UPI000D71B065|nr:MarR family winged helix-turn-helix transcriptional regulator [Actinokineospora spheciospongiae]PWW62373.1 MarR family transcriptional regulator [Actinokineospora spheciospongiae]
MTAEIPALLAMAFRTVMDQVHESLAAEGFDDVRPAHGFVFQYLSQRAAGATAVELGVHLGVTKQAAVQLVDELEQRGYVERGPHPTDRRSRMVVLAPRGRACVASVVRRWGEVEARWGDLIGADRVEHLRADLRRIVADSGQAVALRPVW